MHGIERDIQRHRERLREALRAKLAEVVAEQDIVMAPSGRRLRVPVRLLDEPRFRPAPPAGGASAGAGPGLPGTEHLDPQETVEVDLTIDELAAMLFDQLRLPALTPKTGSTDDEVRVEGVARQGPAARLDKRRTLLEHLKQPDGAWRDDQLRYRDVTVRPHDVLRAVVVFVRDASGSMDDAKRFRVRAAAFWTLRWLRSRYPDVACAFVVHDSAAEEVDEHTFFHVGRMGGTVISSGLVLAQEILEARFPPAQWNRYALFFSDGENFPGDEPALADALRRLHEGCQLVGYGEVEDHLRDTGLLRGLRRLSGRLPRFRAAGIRSDAEVPGWLQAVFGVSDDVA